MKLQNRNPQTSALNLAFSRAPGIPARARQSHCKGLVINYGEWGGGGGLQNGRERQVKFYTHKKGRPKKVLAMQGGRVQIVLGKY